MSEKPQANTEPEGDGFFRLSETDKTFQLRWRSGSLTYQDFKLLSEGGIAKLYSALDENLSKLESVFSSLIESYPTILIQRSSEDSHLNPTLLLNFLA